MNLKRLIGLAFCLMLASLGTSCSSDTATARSCTFDADCELGAVCQLTTNTCIVVPCQDEQGNRICLPEQVCLVTDANPQGSCSAPECTTANDCAEGQCVGGLCSTGGCTTAADCPTGQVCNLAGQCEAGDGSCSADTDCPSGQACVSDACVPGCRSNDECQDTQYCSSAKACVAGCRDASGCGTGQDCREGTCVCTPGSCGEGRVCNTEAGQCEDISSCDQVTCPEGEICNPVILSCETRCTPDSCGVGEACNAQTGVCESSTCPGADTTQCAGTNRPIWDPIRCFCAECTSDTDCNTAAGETCNAAGVCFACETACDSGAPGTCGGATPYCIEDCCVECIGASDCATGELCLQGTCGQPPSCTVDPTVCPAGTTCQNGQCQANQGGGSCDPSDPTTCPAGTFCDPLQGTCSSDIGGGFGCGLCNPDCTCDGGLTCDGFFCGGCRTCVTILGVEVCTEGVDCPNGQSCFPGEAIGFANFCI